MRLTWDSRMPSAGKVKYCPILCSKPCVKTVIKSETHQFNFGSAFRRPSYIHSVVIPKLDPECYYEYTVFNGELESSEYLFYGKTHGESVGKYSLIVYGDLGTHEYGQETFDLIMGSLYTKEVMAVVHLGDIAYDLEDSQGQIGDKFLDMIQPLAAYYPYMTVPGNHDGYRNSTHYSERFIMPRNDASKNTSFYYSLNIGPVHYIFLHSTLFLKPKKANERLAMKNWLKEDLEKVNKTRDSLPWIVTFHHHPLYCSHQIGDSSIRNDCEIQTSIIRYHLEELYYSYKVDLVIAGHLHHYERQAPIYKNRTYPSEVEKPNLYKNPTAPIHIISGSAGNTLHKNDPISVTPDDWSIKMSNDFGFGKLTVVNISTVVWQQFSTETKQLIDEVYIIKDK